MIILKVNCSKSSCTNCINLSESISQKFKSDESFKKAQNYFMQVYEKYPDDQDAPKSLFLSGFILANDLKI